MFEHQLQQLQGPSPLRRLRTMESATGPAWQRLTDRKSSCCHRTTSSAWPHTRPLWRQPSQPQRQYGLDPVRHALVCGSLPPHQTWKPTLARFKGTGRHFTFAAGYLANIGVIPR